MGLFSYYSMGHVNSSKRAHFGYLLIGILKVFTHTNFLKWWIITLNIGFFTTKWSAKLIFLSENTYIKVLFTPNKIENVKCSRWSPAPNHCSFYNIIFQGSGNVRFLLFKGPVYVISCNLPLTVRSTCLRSVPTMIWFNSRGPRDQTKFSILPFCTKLQL